MPATQVQAIMLLNSEVKSDLCPNSMFPNMANLGNGMNGINMSNMVGLNSGNGFINGNGGLGLNANMINALTTGMNGMNTNMSGIASMAPSHMHTQAHVSNAANLGSLNISPANMNGNGGNFARLNTAGIGGGDANAANFRMGAVGPCGANGWQNDAWFNMPHPSSFENLH